MGIIGNEQVDKIAKKALQKKSIEAVIGLSRSEGKSMGKNILKNATKVDKN